MRFDRFDLDEANACLLRDGVAVALPPTPFAVLCALGAIRTRFPEAELLDVEAREVNAGGLAQFNPHRPPDAAA